MIQNEMILASAGSGKTWQLTNRYIAIMAQQLLAGDPVTPERIVAVTFTRKAAGEFFDSILEKLAKASLSEKDAANLCPDPADPLYPILSQLGVADYRRLLRVFIRQMPRLFLGTLDSFFSSILRSFPAEFGLAGDFDILDDHSASIAREQTFRSVFQRDSNDKAAEKAFIEAFRLATFGKEETFIRGMLDQFVDQHHEIYLHAASEGKWGQDHTIWPKGTEWLSSPVNLEECFTQLFAIFSNEDVTDSQFDFWNEFRDEALVHVPGNEPPKRTRFFLEKLFDVWGDIQTGELVITVNRKKQTLSAKACDLLYSIVVHIVGAELKNRLQRTQGIYKVLRLYEHAYSSKVRRRGRLTFQDLELILAGHESGGGANDAPIPILAQRAGEDDRLQIDYRLDARYDHWLLDEFQDTSYLQWSVIANLIDEAVQDTSEMRSLFQVGDMKQAIYAWRGGDTKLFQDILQHYNQGGVERIKPRELNVSWRSGHDVIAMANAVFGTAPALGSMDLPEATLQRWHWQNHTVAPPNEKLSGYAAWYHPTPAPGGGKVTPEDRYAVVVELLEQIQPVKRGLRCAILVQENRAGRDLVDYIRAHSPSKIPVLSESDVTVAQDNPLTMALLSLFQFAAHPGDSWCWNHLTMTPFGEVFTEGKESVSAFVLNQVYEQGFEQTAQYWLDALDIELGPFSQRRSESFTTAARQFDETGSRDIDEFISYAKRYTTKEPDTRSAVQVMTIHKSKGLTFDCVLLPELEGQGLTTIRKKIGVQRNAKREVEWVYETPPKLIAKVDKILQNYHNNREAEAAYESLCKFYVALTRARQAVYLITSPIPKYSRSKNFIKLLDYALGHDREPQPQTIGKQTVQLRYETDEATTNRDWFQEYEILQPSESKETPAPKVQPTPITHIPRPRRSTPSGSELSSVNGRQLFSRGGKAARDYGTLVHELFEEIEWIETFEPKFSRQTAEQKRAAAEVEQTLESSEVRAALSRPSPESQCWREKRFEIMLNGDWVSGTFDRVTLNADSATILDFKTDRVETGEALEQAVESYRPQLEIYRKVLSRMTGLSESAITCQLLFTKRKSVIQV